MGKIVSLCSERAHHTTKKKKKEKEYFTFNFRRIKGSVVEKHVRLKKLVKNKVKKNL